jgi:hypothetical protein
MTPYGSPCLGTGRVSTFAFLKAGDTITVTTLFSHAAGDLELMLFSRDCGPLITVGYSQTDNELVFNTVGADGVYGIRVYGYEGAENRYAMEVAVLSRYRPRIYLPVLMKK